MAVPYSGDVPAVVIFRVRRANEHANVQIWIGQEGAPALCGELTMRAQDWRLFRACLRYHDPSRFSIHYMDDAYDWLHPESVQCLDTDCDSPSQRHVSTDRVAALFAGAARARGGAS